MGWVDVAGRRASALERLVAAWQGGGNGKWCPLSHASSPVPPSHASGAAGRRHAAPPPLHRHPVCTARVALQAAAPHAGLQPRRAPAAADGAGHRARHGERRPQAVCLLLAAAAALFERWGNRQVPAHQGEYADATSQILPPTHPPPPPPTHPIAPFPPAPLQNFLHTCKPPIIHRDLKSPNL